MTVPTPCRAATRPFSVSAVMASRMTVRLTVNISHSTTVDGSVVPAAYRSVTTSRTSSRVTASASTGRLRVTGAICGSSWATRPPLDGLARGCTHAAFAESASIHPLRTHHMYDTVCGDMPPVATRENART